MICTDSGGGTHQFLTWLTGRRLHYSVGMTITDDKQQAILQRPPGATAGQPGTARR